MYTETAVKLAPPRIERMPARRIAGLLQRHDMRELELHPAHWQRFQQYLGHIPNAVPNIAYGVVAGRRWRASAPICAARKSPPPTTCPRASEVLELPARRWARVTHEAISRPSARPSRRSSTSGCRSPATTQAEQINFVEYYGPDFNAAAGLGTCEIWIGLAD